ASLADSAMPTAVSSAVVAEPSSATGGAFDGWTVTFTLADAVPPKPSEIEYWNESLPEKPAAGVYVHSPKPAHETVPCAAAGEGVVTVRGSRSGSESFVSTLTAPGVSTWVTSASSCATGDWSATTVTVTDAVAVCPFPSAIEYWNESGPL